MCADYLESHSWVLKGPVVVSYIRIEREQKGRSGSLCQQYSTCIHFLAAHMFNGGVLRFAGVRGY